MQLQITEALPGLAKTDKVYVFQDGSEVGSRELVQVLRGLKDPASFCTFFTTLLRSLDFLSTLLTSWSQDSCYPSYFISDRKNGKVPGENSFLFWKLQPLWGFPLYLIE